MCVCDRQLEQSPFCIMFALCRDVILMRFVFAWRMLDIIVPINIENLPVNWLGARKRHYIGSAAATVHVVRREYVSHSTFIAAMSCDSWKNYSLAHDTAHRAAYNVGAMRLYCLFLAPIPVLQLHNHSTCQCWCIDDIDRCFSRRKYVTSCTDIR